MSLEQTRVPPTSIPRKLARLGVVVVAGLLIALLWYGLKATSTDNSIDARLAENRSAPAPEFSLELLEPGRLPAPVRSVIAPAAVDGKLGIEELHGSQAVLNFWASWCDPCAEEAPVLEQGWRKWGPRGVVFLGLDMQDLHGDAREFLRAHGVSYPTVRDPGKDVSKSYGATGIPETYFISAQGRVVAHVVGVVSRRQLESGIAAARAGRPLGKRQGGARRPPR